MTNRVSVGIPHFNELIEGGFKEESINVIGGGAGTGKTIFSTQFLVTGALKYNEAGIYISFEENKDKFFEDMKRFGWDLRGLEKKNKFIFLQYTPEKVEEVIQGGSGSIESIVEKSKAKRIVVDSLTAFALLHKNELEKREDALALFSMITKWGCTSILTLEHESGMDYLEHHTITPLEFEADSLVLLYNIRDKNLRVRAIEILKMRGTKHSNKIYPMKITNKGIEIDTKKSVFHR